MSQLYIEADLSMTSFRISCLSYEFVVIYHLLISCCNTVLLLVDRLVFLNLFNYSINMINIGALHLS